MLTEKLQNILADVFELKSSEIVDTLTKEDVDNWDSLKQMDLVVTIEKEFDLSLSFEEIIAIDSVKAITELLAAKGVL